LGVYSSTVKEPEATQPSRNQKRLNRQETRSDSTLRVSISSLYHRVGRCGIRRAVQDRRRPLARQEVEVNVEEVQKDKGLGMMVVPEVMLTNHKPRQHRFKVHYVEARAPVSSSASPLTWDGVETRPSILLMPGRCVLLSLDCGEPPGRVYFPTLQVCVKPPRDQRRLLAPNKARRRRPKRIPMAPNGVKQKQGFHKPYLA
jgi:hypothetical protein